MRSAYKILVRKHEVSISETYSNEEMAKQLPKEACKLEKTAELFV
jgi:hypothetical protein